MDNTESPLKKHKRQPKLYISLPSGGRWYNDKILHNGAHSDLPVFSMTANDEILFKTPDAMVTGNATVENIKSCIPSILDPWAIIQLDIDSILCAIRISSYSELMTVGHKCPKPNCGVENQYQINLSKYLEFFATREFKDTIHVDDYTIILKPLTYRKWTEVQKKTITLQRALYTQSAQIENDEEKLEFQDKIAIAINELAIQTIFDYISSVEIGGEIETDKDEIISWMKDVDLTIFQKVKAVIEQNASDWRTPVEDVVCESCGSENKLQVSLDNSDFFGIG